MRSKPTTVAYLAGSSVTMACYGLWADFLGVDAFCEHARNNWVPAAISVPSLLLVVCFGLWSLTYARKVEKKDEN